MNSDSNADRSAAAATDAARRHLPSRALDVLDAGIVVCDMRQPDQPIVFVNPGFERLTGYRSDEVLGRNCRFLQGPDSDPATVEGICAAIAAGREHHAVILNYRKDGGAFWNELRLTPTRDAAGTLTHFTGVLTDVGEKIEAQQRLQESEGKLRDLLDSTAEAIYGLDHDGICTFCNPSCARMLGYESTDELIGRNMHELIHSKRADGSPHPRKDCKIFRAYLEGEGTHSDAEVFWRRDGTPIPVEYWSYPVRRGEQVVGCVVNFLDMTERKDAANKLLARSQMLETINEINIALAGELELGKLVQRVTDAGRALTGAEFGAFFYSLPDDHGAQYTLYALSGVERSRFEGLAMPRRTELFGPTFADKGIVRIDDVLTDPRYGQNLPYAGIPAGHVSVRSYLAVPVVARNGDAIGALLYGHGKPGQFDETDEQLLSGIAAQAAVAIDNARLFEAAQREIQERKQVEIALEEARRAADQANRSKSEFLANMSHEIRTPMTAILGYADILAAHLTDVDNRECVEVIKSNGRFLLDIVDDILDLSKIETGNLRIESQTFKLADLVADVRSLMEVRALEKKLPLDVEFAGEVPATIATDPTRLRQILINLLSNAIKFTDRGSVRLVVRYLGEHAGHPRLRFDVIDTGVGVDAHLAEQIFRPFRQADTSITREYGGTGLGLAISQRLAQMLGGSISVQSTPGQGSTFSLEIAANQADNVQLIVPAQRSVHRESDSSADYSAIAGRVLVVDDRRDIRFVAQYFLEEAGATVISAHNGHEALELIEEADYDFDLVLMDMQMPVLDGYAATRILRQRGFDKPIIALSAGAMRQDKERALNAGCDMHVAKPVDGHDLVNIVAGHIQTDTVDKPTARRETAGQSDAVDDTAAASAPAPRSDDSGGRRVLIVDDSVDAAQAMLRVLEMMGHEVAAVHGGQDAIDAACELAPDVVLLDLGLPDLDGYTVARRLRDEPRLSGLKIFAVSGRNADPEKLEAAGFDLHFLKPVELTQINDVIMSSGKERQSHG